MTVTFGSCNKTMNWVCLHFLVLLILSTNAVYCGKLVKTLPGFSGELPFKLYTGYTTVEGSEMFYYFIESEGDPKTDPLLLWYSGGPGCSAFNGLIYENGPLDFNITEYDGGIPKTYYYPYSWTRTASILYVDAPVGTGFSYATDASEYATSDTKTATQVYAFLKNWLAEHPQYLKLQLFVGADSYAGISGTIVVKHIIDGNDAGDSLRLNLKGYILGCPRTDETINENSKYVFAHRMGLISDDLYHAAAESCNSSFYGATTDQPECYEDLQIIARQIKDINKNHILEPKCTWSSPKEDEEPARRSMQENLYPEDFIRSPLKSPEYCHTFSYALSYVWANDDEVRAALNVRRRTVFDWKRCNKSLDYTYDVASVLEYHQNLSTKGLQVLVFNGDHDLIMPNPGTEEWIKKLGLTVVNDWRPWLVDGQIAGYTIKYSENGYRLTYATLKGAGHSPTEYKRREGYMMFDRFIHYYPV